MTFEEKTLDTQRIYEGAIINLRRDKVTVQNGTSYREIVEHNGGAVLAALTPEGKMVMVRQFRKPAERVMLEVPAGKIDAGELPERAAVRELKEETGLTEDALEGLKLRYITMRNKDGEIRQNYYYFAEIKAGFDVSSSNEGRLEWHSMGSLDDLPMPVTARHVVDHYLQVGRHNDKLYGGLTTSDGSVFAVLDDF